jgi:enediyne biosynthesis protein E4
MKPAWISKAAISAIPIIIAAGMLLVTAQNKPGASLPSFTDITSAAGIRFKHLSGAPEKNFIFEAKGGGIGLLDYDKDGFLDIYFINGNTVENLARGIVSPNALYHSNGDGTYTDVTNRAGVQGRGWGMGCAVGDFDNDGWPDIYVLCLTGNILYRNNHDGTFTDETEKSGLRDGKWSTGAAFVDYDRDGYLDLYVSHYSVFNPEKMQRKGDNRYCNYRGIPVMCGPRGLDGEEDSLFHNNGDGTFTDVSTASGIRGRDKYYGLGVAVGDYNNDGWPDIYVANDSCPSFLFLNRKNGKFEETALSAGVAVSDDGAEQAGMGVDFGDYDNDGWLDLTKTNFSYDYNNLYHNDHNGMFMERARAAGIAQVTMPFVCWGTRFIDYDNDGWKDIFVAAGHVYPHLIANPVGGEKYFQRKLLFRNLGNGAFADVSTTSGAGLLLEKASRGAAFGDIDNDGDIDAVVANLDDIPSLLRNDGGNAGNWILVELRGTKTNRLGLGSRVTVKAGALQQIGEATTASSIFSANDPRIHFGLGKSTEADLEVRWLSGKIQSFKGVEANRILVIDEDQGIINSPAGKN